MASCINYILYDLLKLYYANKKFGINPFNKDIIKFFVSGFVVVIIFLGAKELFVINIYNLAVLSIVAFIIYDSILNLYFKYEFSLIRKIYQKVMR